MKTAYELAMERLNKNSPATSVPLTTTQKKELANLDSKYAARIAEREIALKGEIDRAAETGEMERADQLRQQLIDERKALQAELQQKKDQVRSGK